MFKVADLIKIQCAKDRFRNSYSSSFPLISSYKNSDSDDRKQEGVADSIIGDEDNTYINSCSWSFLTNH